MIWMGELCGARPFSKMSNNSMFGQLERPASRELRSIPHPTSWEGDCGPEVTVQQVRMGSPQSLFFASPCEEEVKAGGEGTNVESPRRCGWKALAYLLFP